jgi:hypothetical protein
VPSFDIVSKTDMQEIDNAVNNTLKAIGSRFDFRGSKTTLTFDQKEKKLKVNTEDEMKMKAVKEMFEQAAVKRKLDLKTFDFGDVQPGPAGSVKRDITVREGIPQELAKRIVKLIKDSKMKVQASIQGDEVRVSGKKIDDLQEVIALVRGGGFEAPLQFVNFKS